MNSDLPAFYRVAKGLPTEVHDDGTVRLGGLHYHCMGIKCVAEPVANTVSQPVMHAIVQHVQTVFAAIVHLFA